MIDQGVTVEGQRPSLWRRLPKSELHVHLRGAMPIAVFTELLNRYAHDDLNARLSEAHRDLFNRYDNIRPFLTPRTWSTDEVSRLFQYAHFDQFLATFAFTGWFIRCGDDFRRLVEAVLADLHRQQIVYAEITVSALEYVRQGTPLPELLAILDGAAATVADLQVQWIIDPVRNFGPESALALVHELGAARCQSVVGITLGGAEHRFPPAPFQAVYAAARAYGLRPTVHAGEALGPESVWDAVRLLGVERIGHGVRAIEERRLVDYLAERQLPLEVCPTSNLCTGIYTSHADHPLRALHQAGIPITLNSDDPTFFGATLADEYEQLEQAGLPATELLEIVKNGFRHAFLSAEERAHYLQRVEVAWGALTSSQPPGSTEASTR